MSELSLLEQIVGPEVLEDYRVKLALEDAERAIAKFHRILKLVSAEKGVIRK